MSENTLDEKQYVVFKLGAEMFGVDINKVKEIIVYHNITQIPGTTYPIEGVINLRGVIVPIFSLRKKFGSPEIEESLKTRIVVVEAHGNTVGIEVDGVSEVLMIPESIIIN